MTKIGFIGASGLMGHGMARNLLRKGHSVRLTVHRNRDRVIDLLQAGALETWLGEAVHQSLTLACALGYGASFVPALVRAQEKTNGAVIVPAAGQAPSSAA